MTILDPDRLGTLETLDDLREDGRRRFMKRRTRDELEDILVAAWQERDEAKAKKEVQSITTETVSFETPTVKTGAPTSGSDGDITVMKKFDLDQINSLENSEDDCWPQKSMTAMQLRKSSRVVTTKKGVARYVPSPRTKQDTTSLKPGSENRILPQLRAIKKQANTFKPSGGSKLISDSSVQSIDHLSIVLHVPGNYNDVHLPSIEQLPIMVHAELKHRLDRHRTGSLSKAYAFQRLIKNPGFYEDRPYCVCDQIMRGLRAKEHGRPVRPQTFEQGGRLRLRADDKCIRDGIPCVHILKQDGEYALCIVPLPKGAQQSVSWKELGFWVQE